jgi:hypothetical protein
LILFAGLKGTRHPEGRYAAEGVIDLGLGLGRMNTAVDDDKVGEG